jgi:hypothetical protein
MISADQLLQRSAAGPAAINNLSSCFLLSQNPVAVAFQILLVPVTLTGLALRPVKVMPNLD